MSYNRTISQLQGKDIFLFGSSCTDATKSGLYFGGIWDLPRAAILCLVTSDNVLKQFWLEELSVPVYNCLILPYSSLKIFPALRNLPWVQKHETNICYGIYIWRFRLFWGSFQKLLAGCSAGNSLNEAGLMGFVQVRHSKSQCSMNHYQSFGCTLRQYVSTGNLAFKACRFDFEF